MGLGVLSGKCGDRGMCGAQEESMLIQESGEEDLSPGLSPGALPGESAGEEVSRPEEIPLS